jgi:hypothetical protein
MIGPGGSLLVVSHLFAVPVSVLWVGLQKSKITKLGCEKYFFSQGCVLSTGGASPPQNCKQLLDVKIE